MRSMRDRLAELLRLARLGGHGGKYDQLPADTQEDWRHSADYILANAGVMDIQIKDLRL